MSTRQSQPLKARFVPAVIDYEPYEDETDPGFPAFAPVSMVGTCPIHGFQRITAERVTPGSDPTAYFVFQCGDIDGNRF